MTALSATAKKMPTQSIRRACRGTCASGKAGLTSTAISAPPLVPGDGAHIEEAKSDADEEADHRLGNGVQRIVAGIEGALHVGPHHFGRCRPEHIGQRKSRKEPQDGE